MGPGLAGRGGWGLVHIRAETKWGSMESLRVDVFVEAGPVPAPEELGRRLSMDSISKTWSS